jgi:hypothetical protein
MGKVAVALGTSGIGYAAPYFFLGVSSDFRYLYWIVLAGTLSIVVLGGAFAARGRAALWEYAKRRMNGQSEAY